MVINFDPPEHCPPYREKCRCERLSLDTREKVERASRALFLQSKEEEERRGGLLNDEWFRSRIKVPNGPIMTLHEHYAGMGGRSTMGQGVGGFALGAACPSGGLCTVTAVSYDLPWFAKLMNHYLMSILNNHTDEDCMTYNSKLPSTFCCWQLNFGKNDSDKLSETCFYNPHVDKNNAKVSSIGTSFGDYEGGGVWVANPKGTTMVKFENDVEGIHRGLVPGQVASQKTRWVTFWAATNVHAIPPFRKNRIGVVAFSSQTALRATPEERKMLLSLGFPLPNDGDVRFLPKIPRLLALKGDDLANLTREELEERKLQTLEYNRLMAAHQRNCDKMSIALARETEKLNLCRVEGETTKLIDGTSRVVVQRKIDSEEIENKRNKGFERNMLAMEAEVATLINSVEFLERRIRGKRRLTHPNAPAQAQEMEQVLQRIHAEFRATLIDEHVAPESDDDALDEEGVIITNAASATSIPVAKSHSKILKASLQSPIKIRDSLPLLPFNKRLPLSRSDRKKLEKGRWRHKLKYGSLDTWKCPVTTSASSTDTGSTASKSTSTSSSEHKKTAATSQKEKTSAPTAKTKASPPSAKNANHAKASPPSAKHVNHTKASPPSAKHANHAKSSPSSAKLAKASPPLSKHAHEQQQSEVFTSPPDIWPPRTHLSASNAHRNAHAALLGFASMRHLSARPSLPQNVNDTSRKRLYGAMDNGSTESITWQPPMKQVRTMGSMIRQPFLPGEVVLLDPETIAVEE